MVDGLAPAIELTSDEEAFGFTVLAGVIRMAVCKLADGLRAIKMRALDGSVEYVVLNGRMQPIYNTRDLTELRRFK